MTVEVNTGRVSSDVNVSENVSANVPNVTVTAAVGGTDVAASADVTSGVEANADVNLDASVDGDVTIASDATLDADASLGTVDAGATFEGVTIMASGPATGTTLDATVAADVLVGLPVLTIGGPCGCQPGGIGLGGLLVNASIAADVSLNLPVVVTLGGVCGCGTHGGIWLDADVFADLIGLTANADAQLARRRRGREGGGRPQARHGRDDDRRG